MTDYNLNKWLAPEKEILMQFEKEELIEQLLIALEIIREKNKLLERNYGRQTPI